MYGRPIGGFGHGGWFRSRRFFMVVLDIHHFLVEVSFQGFVAGALLSPGFGYGGIWLSVLLGLFLLYRLPTRSILFLQYRY